MIAFYDVNIQYNLEELEKNFESIEDLEKLDFIDSEEYLAQKNR
jgi:adenylosuccinate synthase